MSDEKPLVVKPAPKKQLIAIRESGKKWRLVLSDNLTQLDINHLARRLRVDFRRQKTINRIAKRKAERALEKEPVNV